MEWYIYKLVFENGKVYVGQTNSPERRLDEHRRGSGCRLSENAINKYGTDSFHLVVIESCDSKEQANVRESFWIDKLGSLAPSGYNLNNLVDGNYQVSEETRLLMSEKNRGENNPMFGRRGQDSPWYGRSHSQAAKDKLRQINTGRPSSRKGKSISETHRRRIAEARRGSSHSEETKIKMSIAQKKRWARSTK